MRVLRNAYGRWFYWLGGAVISAFGFLIEPHTPAYTFISIWVTVGLYSEFEERGKAGNWAALLSVAVGSLFQLATPYYPAFRVQMEELVKTMGKPDSMGWGLNISGETLLSLVPSGILVANIMALAFALILDRRVAQLVGLPFERIASQVKLLEFRLPDFAIWVTMLSFLFSFWETTTAIRVFSLNTLIVMMALYFFQGLAVAEFGMLLWRLGFFWRLPFYLFVVGQLFFLISVVGVIDYWADFRNRMRRWRFSERNPKNGERI